MRDDSNSTIYKTCEKDQHFDTVKVIQFSRNDSLIEGLDVDWVGRLVFWTNMKTDRIEVCDYSGEKHAILPIHHANIQSPKDIKVDPLHGKFI